MVVAAHWQGKREIIRQIRALERAPRESAKVFDRAEANFVSAVRKNLEEQARA